MNRLMYVNLVMDENSVIEDVSELSPLANSESQLTRFNPKNVLSQFNSLRQVMKRINHKFHYTCALNILYKGDEIIISVMGVLLNGKFVNPTNPSTYETKLQDIIISQLNKYNSTKRYIGDTPMLNFRDSMDYMDVVDEDVTDSEPTHTKTKFNKIRPDIYFHWVW